MFTPTHSQRRHLKALAHHRKPVVLVGERGLTPAVMREIAQALDHHELIKIRINAGDRLARETMIADICAATAAIPIQRVGHIATLFRRNPEAPRIEWP